MTVPAQLVLPTPLAAERAGWPYITVLSVNGYPHRVKADEPYRGNFRWSTGWGYSEQASVDDEGNEWVRGWHEKDSPEVKALKVARALR